jgi:hypothetical protein
VSVCAHAAARGCDVLSSSADGATMQILRQRPDLRIVISSATAHVDKLAAFFSVHACTSAAMAHPSCAPAVLVTQGREYAVQRHYLTVRSTSAFRHPCMHPRNFEVGGVELSGFCVMA